MRYAVLVGVVLSSTIADAAVVSINPIRVCDDAGSNCAPVNFHSEFTNKIFAQIDTTLSIGPTKQLNSSLYLNPTEANANALIDSGTLFGSTEREFFAYDVWFVNIIDGKPGFRGLAALGGDGAVIASTAAVDTLAHELAHNFGYAHTDQTLVDADRYLLAEGSIRTIPTTVDDIAPDGRQLSRFDPVLPEVTVDMIGATPFQSRDFFDVIFKPGAATDLGLASLSIDLSPSGAFFDVTDAPPGNAGSPFGYGTLNGIAASDISVSGLSDGSTFLQLDFARGSFTSGDAFSFGLDIDLFSAIDEFGATPDELRRSVATLTFENGFSVAGDLSTLIFSSIIDPNANIDKSSRLRGDPPAIDPISVPAPATSWIPFCVALCALGIRRRTMSRRTADDQSIA